MAATSVSAAKNRMARAVDSILDPWPADKAVIWDYFGSECAYCGVKLVRGERLGHIDHATSKAGNHMGNLVPACSVCNGDEKLDIDLARVPRAESQRRGAAPRAYRAN